MNISIFAESIKRLYTYRLIDVEKILELKQNKKLTIEEFNFILDNDNY